MQEAKRLRAAFLEKERNQGFLANLERLRAQGSVTSQQYAAMKHDYQQKMMSAVSEIASAKRQLSVKLQAAKQDLNSSKTALEGLRAKYNTGNLSMAEYHSSERKLTDRIDATRTEVAHLQKLVDAKSSGEIAATETEGKAAKERRLAFPRWAVTVAIAILLLVLGVLGFLWVGGFSAVPEIDHEPPPVTTEPGLPEETPQPPPPPPASSSVADMIERVQPSVVLIACAKYTHSQQYDSSGSGVIVDGRGYILTNKHVIQGEQVIDVFLYEGGEVRVERDKAYEATVIKTHPTADLAVIKISPGYTSLTEAMLGDSDSLRPGDTIIAVGYPLVGFFYEEASQSVGSPTITKGMVSAEERRIEGVPHIQIDAALNPGNSGGALINADGEVVGTPTFRWEETPEGRTIQNMNFAIAINHAKPFIEQALGK